MPGPGTALAGVVCVVIAVTPFISVPVIARDKSDVLVMKNGDRITCEVKRLDAGVLYVNLDYVDGTVAIDWRKVGHVESEGLFLVQLQDGSVYSGRVVSTAASPGAPATLEVRPEGKAPVVVDQSDVVRVFETSESLMQRFSGDIGLGASYSKGNSTTQYNINSELDYQETRWGARSSFSANLTSSTGAETSTRNQLDFFVYRLMPWKNYLYGATAGFLQSSVQDVHLQTSMALAAGRYFKNTNRLRFWILAGPGWQRTDYVATTAPQKEQNIAVAVVSGNLEAFVFKKTHFSLDASAAPALTQSGRTFSKINASYYLKLFGKVDWNMSLYGNWDTRPPAHLQSSDYGTSTGLSWTWGNK